MWYSSIMLRELVEPLYRSLVTPYRAARGLFIDERKAERLPISLPVRYRISLIDRCLEGQTQTVDLSSGGVQIAIKEMVSPGTACQIALTLPAEPEALSFEGHIAWCRVARGVARERYEAGIAFAAPSSYTDPGVARLSRFIAVSLLTRHLG